MSYNNISTLSLSSTASSVEITSIPDSYTDLVLIIGTTISTTARSIRLQYNGDTATNYSYQNMLAYSGGALAQIAGTIDHTRISGDCASNFRNLYICNIFDYANTTTRKVQLSRGMVAGNSSVVDAHVGVWRNTSAITSLKIYPNTGTFSADSIFALYGIKAK